jgi:hypothetical protein
MRCPDGRVQCNLPGADRHLPWLNILPGLLGVFIGAPLVAREIEDGTWRLAWSQGITRRTWMRGQITGTVAIISLSAARADLCQVTGVNGGTTGSGRAEIHCLGGAGFSARLDVVTPWAYLNTAATAILDHL